MSKIKVDELDAYSATAVEVQTKLDMDAKELILDADGDTSITADTDDQIDISVAGADDFQITANTLTALSGSVIETNIINETTAASGVTIDGVLVKDNEIASSYISFTPSGSGAIAEAVSAALQRLPHTAQYSTQGNWETARDALTGTFGMANLDVTGTVKFPSSGGAAGEYPFRIVPVTGETANFSMAIADFDFTTYFNTVLSFGYNPNPAGDREDATESAIYITFESHFEQGGNPLLEYHIQGVRDDGTNFRAFSIAAHRDSVETELSFATSLLSFLDATEANDYIAITSTTTTAAISLASGTKFQKSANNQSWLEQLNAAGSAHIEMMRVNASNFILIGPSGDNARFGGQVGITSDPSAAIALGIGGGSNLTGTQQTKVQVSGAFSSGATSHGIGYHAILSTAVASYTMSEMSGFLMNNPALGAGSAITTLAGLRVEDLTRGTSNYGAWLRLSAGANKYNIYADGTAQNYLAGVTGVGNTPSSTTALILPAGTTGVSSLRVPHGAAPTSPVNGDIWTTTAGIFVRINGATVGPLS